MKILVFFTLASLSFAAKDEEAFFNMRQEWCGEKNCYDVIGVPPTAEPSVIKEAYKKLSKDLHPDKCPDCDPARMTAVNAAYSILSNAKNRDMYDRVLKVKRQVDAPKENTVLVCLLVFALITAVVFQFQTAQFKEIKKGALNIPKVKRELLEKCPEAYPKQLDRKAAKKLKRQLSKKNTDEKQEEKDPVELVPNDILDTVLTANNIPVKGWTAEAPTPQSAAIEVLKFPLTFTMWLFFQVSWQLKYTLMKQELSRKDKIYLLCEKHDLDVESFNNMSWKKKAEYLQKPGEWTDLFEEMEAEHKK